MLWILLQLLGRRAATVQTLTEIRHLLAEAHLRPNKQFGQNFLVDRNLMGKVLDLADLTGTEHVLEVGPGTGSLTEELLARAANVLAVEIDHGLAAVLRERLGHRPGLRLMEADILCGKHALSPEVLAALPGTVHVVANLPYNIATPLIALCLCASHAARSGRSPQASTFQRLTFTVQREVADRLAAGPGSKTYGPLSVTVALLGRITPGPVVPAAAFWPPPNVASRIVRIDFDPVAAADLTDTDVLRRLLVLAFSQRRKQIGSVLRRKDAAWPADALAGALQAAGIDRTARPERVAPGQFRLAANALAETPPH